MTEVKDMPKWTMVKDVPNEERSEVKEMPKCEVKDVPKWRENQGQGCAQVDFISAPLSENAQLRV